MSSTYTIKEFVVSVYKNLYIVSYHNKVTDFFILEKIIKEEKKRLLGWNLKFNIQNMNQENRRTI